MTTDFPPEVELTLEAAVQRQRHVTQNLITDYTTEKRQEFKTWREEARKQAKMIAKVAENVSKPALSPSSTPKAALAIPPSQGEQPAQSTDLFQKSPVTQHTHSGTSPLAAVSLMRSQSERRSSPSPPSSKVTPPPIPLSSSLKFPGSSNYSKPVKRVMFQDPPDEEVQSDGEPEIHTDALNIPITASPEPTISVDGMPLLLNNVHGR